MGEISCLDKSGDSKIIWDPKNKVEVKAAKAQFDTLIEEGYQAFSVDKEGEADEVLKRFDPKAGKIIMIPQVEGG